MIICFIIPFMLDILLCCAGCTLIAWPGIISQENAVSPAVLFLIIACGKRAYKAKNNGICKYDRKFSKMLTEISFALKSKKRTNAMDDGKLDKRLTNFNKRVQIGGEIEHVFTKEFVFVMRLIETGFETFDKF